MTADRPQNRNDRRRAWTRARLLEAAQAEIARSGLAETSVAAITEAADVATGSFYNYFTSKDDIVAALVEEMVYELGAMLTAAAREAPTHTEALIAALEGLMGWFNADEQRARFAVRIASSNEMLRDAVGLPLTDIVVRGTAAGEFDVEPVAATIMIGGGVIAMFDVQTKAMLSAEQATAAFIELSLRIVGASR